MKINIFSTIPSIYDLMLIVGILVALLVFAIMFFVVIPILRCWMRGISSGARISLFSVLAMRLNGIPMNLIVDTVSTLHSHGHQVRVSDVERIFLANPERIVDAVLLADQVEKDLNIKSK